MTPKANQARVLAVTSGKGGVGKTNISTNLAIALARQGKKVCVFDADTSLANVNILLNITPRYTLEHVLNGQVGIHQVLLSGPGQIQIVPAASGIAEAANLNSAQQGILLAALRELEQQFDYLLIDTAAGIGESVLRFIQAASHCLLVVTPEPTSLTDAFALLKVLQRRQKNTKMHVLVNMVDSYPHSIDIYKRLAGATSKYLNMRPEFFGYMPRDDTLRLAVERQVPVTVAYPGSPSASRFFSLARSMDSLLSTQQEPGMFSRFWQTVLQGPAQPSGGLRDQSDAAFSTPAARAAAVDPAPAGTSETQPTSASQQLQSMVKLLHSRRLPVKIMEKFASALLLAIHRHYPGIDIESLNKRVRGSEQPRHRERSDKTDDTSVE